MKKLLIALLLVALMPLTALGAVTEGNNVIQMTAADDTTTSVFAISVIMWASAAGSEVAATDGFLLEDGAGVVIAAAEATTVRDTFLLVLPEPIIVSGLKAEDLDAGHLFIYGKRR